MVRLRERERLGLINSLYSLVPRPEYEATTCIDFCGSLVPMRLSLATPVCPASGKLGSVLGMRVVPWWE